MDHTERFITAFYYAVAGIFFGARVSNFFIPLSQSYNKLSPYCNFYSHLLFCFRLCISS